MVDPANYPQSPAAPNRPRILLLGLFLGLAGGVGIALLLDQLDTSIKTNKDFEDFPNVTLLGVLPTVMTRGLVLEQRRAWNRLFLCSVGALAVGVVFIRIMGPSLPVFLPYVADLLRSFRVDARTLQHYAGSKFPVLERKP